jgi:hypothetical protein
MPFTFSHSAIVLPLTFLPRKWFSLTGLVIGSMTPDFEYFLRMKTQSNYSHTIAGIFWFDLPLAILLTFLFHNIVRECLFQNIPITIKSRLLVYNDFDWNQYFKANLFVVISSILIGVASHLFWDSFTHIHGYFVDRIPGLNQIIQISNFQVPVFKILQHSSTFVGAIIIFIALMKLPADKSISPNLNLKYWTALTLIIIVVVSLRVSTGLSIIQYGHFIITCISATLLGLIITPMIIKATAGNTR